MGWAALLRLDWLLRIFTALFWRSVAFVVTCLEESFCFNFWAERKAFICVKLIPLAQAKGLVKRRADRVKVISRDGPPASWRFGASWGPTTTMSSSSSISLGASEDPVDPVVGLAATSLSEPNVKAGWTSPPTTTHSSASEGDVELTLAWAYILKIYLLWIMDIH